MSLRSLVTGRGGDRRGVANMLRWGLLANLALLALGCLVTALVAGGAALSFAVAVGVVAAFFVLGILGLRRLLAGADEMALAGAMGVYVLQLSLVSAVLLLLRQAPWLHVNAFAAGAIAATIVWQAGLVEGLRRARQPVYADPLSR